MVNGGLRYTLNFPSVEQHDQAAVFNLATEQLEFLGRDGQPRAARQLHKLNFGPRLGIVGRMTDRTVARVAYGLVWIEMAGITTPFTTPVFPFLQTVSQRTLDNITPAFTLAAGPSVAPILLTPDAGIGQGVFSVDRDLGSGYVRQWNASLERELTSNIAVEVAYVGSKITRVGLPDVNLNQLTAEQLAQGPSLLQRVPNPFFGVIPRSSSLGDPTIPVAQLLKPYPRFTTVSLYRNNVGTTIYQGVYAKLEHRPSRGLSYLLSYTRSKLMDDASSVFDASILTGPVANFPVADSFNRRLERDYSTGDIPHVFVASAVWEVPFGTGRPRRAGGLTGALVNDWTLTGVLTLQSGMPIAIAQTTNNNAFAGFGTQRPNLIGDRALPSGERSVSRWFNTSAFAAAPSSRSARARATRCAARASETSTSRSSGVCPCRAAPPWSCARRSSTRPTARPLARRERHRRFRRVRHHHHRRRPENHPAGGESCCSEGRNPKCVKPKGRGFRASAGSADRTASRLTDRIVSRRDGGRQLAKTFGNPHRCPSERPGTPIAVAIGTQGKDGERGREEHSMDDNDHVGADYQCDGAPNRGLNRDPFVRCVRRDTGHPYRIPFSITSIRLRSALAVRPAVAGCPGDFR